MKLLFRGPNPEISEARHLTQVMLLGVYCVV